MHTEQGKGQARIFDQQPSQVGVITSGPGARWPRGEGRAKLASGDKPARGGREKGLEATRRDKVSFITSDLVRT